MSSVSTKHSYRFGYLKSEHWKNLRIKKLARERGHCSMCMTSKWGNDVHHIRYPKNLYETTISDLRVLCRTCHEAVHEAMDAHPEYKTFFDTKVAWKGIKYHARKLLIKRGHLVRHKNSKLRSQIIATDRARGEFRRARGRLYYGEDAVIKKWEMPWDDRLAALAPTGREKIPDAIWLSESQKLNGWKCVWPQGEH